MEQATISNLIYPILLKNLEASIGCVANNQEDTNKILAEICNAIQKVNIENAIKYDIFDAESIKRRLYRIKIIVGNYTGPNSHDDIIKDWEYCVQQNLSMTRAELFQSIERRQERIRVFDVIGEIPEFRKIGVDTLLAFERKYNIPPAFYSVEQVRQVDALRNQFNHSVISLMNERDFTYWVNNRCAEADDMFEGYKKKNHTGFNYGRYQLYWMFAVAHPELIPEKQLKYLSEQELINVVNRAVNDKDVPYYGSQRKYFPLSDRKHDTKTLKDSFIDIVLRGLIA